MKKAIKQFCILGASLFTLLTLISSILNLALGQTHDTHVHILMRAGFVFIGVFATVFYLHFPLKTRVLRYILPYAIAQGLVFTLLFFIGLATPLHKDAYRDAFFNFTFVAIPIMLSLYVIDRIKQKKGA